MPVYIFVVIHTLYTLYKYIHIYLYIEYIKGLYKSTEKRQLENEQKTEQAFQK